MGVIYISHRLEEIFAIADRVDVLRDGRKSATRALGELTTKEELIRMMVGRDLDGHLPQGGRPHRRRVFASVERTRRGRGCTTSLRCSPGESWASPGWWARAGPSWRGRCSAPIRRRRRASGSAAAVAIDSPRRAVALALGLVTEDRKRQGLMLDMSVAANICLATLRALPARRSSTGRERGPPTVRRRGCASRRAVDRAGGTSQRRQPAEGRARQVAGRAADGADSRRADARHRRRGQGRDLRADRRAGRPKAWRSS